MAGSPFDRLESEVLKKESKVKKSNIFSGFLDCIKSVFSRKSVQEKDQVKERIRFSFPAEAKSIAAAVGIACGVMLILQEAPGHSIFVVGVALESLGFCYLFR